MFERCQSYDHMLPASFSAALLLPWWDQKQVVPGMKVSGRATALVSVSVSRFFFAVMTVSCWKPWQVPQIGK